MDSFFGANCQAVCVYIYTHKMCVVYEEYWDQQGIHMPASCSPMHLGKLDFRGLAKYSNIFKRISGTFVELLE